VVYSKAESNPVPVGTIFAYACAGYESELPHPPRHHSRKHPLRIIANSLDFESGRVKLLSRLLLASNALPLHRERVSEEKSLLIEVGGIVRLPPLRRCYEANNKDTSGA
jgi:hypothetical protein